MPTLSLYEMHQHEKGTLRAQLSVPYFKVPAVRHTIG